ncbi:MAG: TonB-dependent receptor plug domain-containing protein [Pseudomonadales bacterium]|jgi:iron complex outermembrane receptor protein|nr:TonB-dependent receptor plug domain-containing protein [Pseudomonadales bacterium]MCP5171300.1 TonB-dependent receptor plug domain-containing protein [Pseudomonadales bacterium]
MPLQSGTFGIESAVAMYLDDVYISGHIDAVMELNNIERIEVLKGPQGTLFSRNTTGGVIHVITKDPTSEPQAEIEEKLGNYDTYGGSFYGSTGLTEDLVADMALQFQRQDEGYGVNQSFVKFYFEYKYNPAFCWSDLDYQRMN